MIDDSFKNQCIFHILDALREGLSLFSQPSRVAIIYAITPDDPVHICDPQDLLRGHEPKFKEIYLDSNDWRTHAMSTKGMEFLGEVHPEKNLQLAGLISHGGRSNSIFYQMWFSEHHPDMCSIGPTERWFEHAVWLLSQDFVSENIVCLGTSRYVLQEYATHALRDCIVDERIAMLGWDTQLRVYPVLDAVLGISKTLEEGAWPRGEMIFVEPGALHEIEFIARFPYLERPRLKNFKHVRKLLLAVENSNRKLVSDGKDVVGVATGHMPKASIIAEFRSGHGFIRLDKNPICSFSNGNFHSSTHKAKLVQVEEALLESKIHPSTGHLLFQIVSRIVHNAEEEKFGCTLVIDLKDQPTEISGQRLDQPLDLQQENLLELAESLAKIDGALHIGADMMLHGFAFLLDGHAVSGENRARGARFNSALRFSAEHDDLIIVVVSADRPVSIIQGGVDLTARSEWKPLSGSAFSPQTLEEWLKG